MPNRINPDTPVIWIGGGRDAEIRSGTLLSYSSDGQSFHSGAGIRHEGGTAANVKVAGQTFPERVVVVALRKDTPTNRETMKTRVAQMNLARAERRRLNGT